MKTPMFSEATRKFVRQVCPEGDLISNPNIIDSKKLLEPTILVIKIKPKFKPFQKNKYRVSNETLEDYFGDLPGNQAEMKTSCFMEKFGFATKNRQQGNVSGDVPHCGGKLEGHNSATLQMTFGQLDVMEFVNFKALRMFIKGRKLLTTPELKKNERLVLVKDRILTTSSSPMESTDEVDASCLATAKVFLWKLQGGGDHSSSQNTSITVPPKTVIAYNVFEVNELNVNSVRHEAQDGLQTDSGSSMCDIIYKPSINSLPVVLKELQDFEEKLKPLAYLEQNIRSSLYKELRWVLKDRSTFQRFLEDTLEGWWETGTREEPVGTLLDQLPMEPKAPSHFAVQLLISALEALPDGALNMLANCSPDELHTLNSLVARLKTGNSQPLPAELMPSNLQKNGEYDWATRLFCSPNEVLREEGLLWEDVGMQPGGVLLLLCITVQGFVCLSG